MFVGVVKMSCCGGNCGCGDNCKCGSGCGGCKAFPEKVVEAPLLAATASDMEFYEEVSVAGENGCKCGDSCTCDPCNCK
ncbi:hypothetical protein E8P77_33390 [Soehngenia saccharolytica]|nr:hypothetical protein E8P77_33390 [Soehngenia saccharolytica]